MVKFRPKDLINSNVVDEQDKNAISNNQNKLSSNDKYNDEHAKKNYALRNRTNYFLNERLCLNKIILINNKKNKLNELIKEALCTINIKKKYGEDENKNYRKQKISIYNKINENNKNKKENKGLNNVNLNIANSELSTNFEEDNKKQPPKYCRKGERSNSKKNKFSINIIKFKKFSNDEDQYFHLYMDKKIGFKKSKIIKEVKNLELDFDVDTDEGQLKIEKKKVYNNLFKSAKKILTRTDYIKDFLSRPTKFKS